MNVLGSSPLARGLRRLSRSRPPLGRIIPARAGFTLADDSGGCHVRDHPRSRGVYTIIEDPRLPEKGSSPLARGLPGFSPGMIPTVSDHPRSRGVYHGGKYEIPFGRGSSPLARGLR